LVFLRHVDGYQVGRDLMTYSGSRDGEPVLVRQWPRSARCVGVARQELRRQLEAWGLSRLAETAELVLSELFGNAVRHACPPRGRQIETRYERALGGVRMEVHDANENWPELRKATADEECGRGLLLVDALTGSRWGVSERDGVGKRVWAVVADEDDPAVPIAARDAQERASR
jgi:serine/threonine-protein kinase RsbW